MSRIKEVITKKEFRADINGLRALAVILVVLFHLEYHFMRTGYLGVDVFLIISGYLITKNILWDLQQERFSFKEFYTRRFKRLFPPLFFTLAVSLFAGFLLLSHSNLEELGKSTISGIFSVSNIFFWMQKGYFDQDSAFKPLLHIWSLSLEEQFYLIWPFLLIGIFKFFRKYLLWSIIGLVLLSVSLRFYYIPLYPDSVFYLLPYRFFEFLLGAACIWLERYRTKNIFLLEFLHFFGLFLIIFSAIGFIKPGALRGILTFIPCLGTMMVIYAGMTKSCRWTLQNKLVGIIGRSSYSIYLIHWPLIVYYKYWAFVELTFISKLIIGLLSVVLGYLMWKYIENTFRNSKIRIRKIDFLWVWMPSLVLILSFFSLEIWINKGYPGRFSSKFGMTNEQILAERKNYWDYADTNRAILKGSNGKIVMMMGNSHAIDLLYALRNNGFRSNVVMLPTSFNCYNFGSPLEEENIAECEEKKKINLKDPNWPKADAIYLHDHWPKKDLPDLKNVISEIRKLSNAPIYVFGPKMIFSQSIPDIIHSCRSSSSTVINNYAQGFAQLSSREELNNALIDFFKDLYFKNNNVFYIDVLGVQGGRKNVFDIVSSKSLEFLYFDKNHFTEAGATEFGAKLKIADPFLFN